MNAVVFIAWPPTSFIDGTVRPIAFFPARAVGDEIGNYAIASAGTITSKDNTDITGNMNTTTESVCPKGWTLPTIKQLDNNRDTTNFSPVLGGYYTNGTLNNEVTNGYWWGSEASNGARRYNLAYNGSSLSTGNSTRRSGFYVRCVSEEKTVTDLTYLQDMTGEIANNTLDGYRELTTYDLVTYGPSGKECYGAYNSTSQKGWGPAYENSCIHSGTIKALGDLPTNWYNYTLATAGTIIDENATSSNPATNTTAATESICPKGWTLPNKTQIDSQRDVSSFSPVLGGNYGNGTLVYETTNGYWWGSNAYNGASRYSLYYNGNNLYNGNNGRYLGRYIRCVQAP